MMTDLPSPSPSDFLSSDTYWPESRERPRANSLPGGDWELRLEPILQTFHAAKDQQLRPIVIDDGSMIPRVDKTRGIVRLTVDSYTVDRLRAPIKYLVPSKARKSADIATFDAVATQMANNPFYDGPSAAMRFTDDDGIWRISTKIRRAVVYAVASPNDGWFSGFDSRAMKRKPGSWLPPNTTFRGLDAEVYSRNVGDIRHQYPSERAQFEVLHYREKVSQAMLFFY